jgi:predicted anti-sigma-YlaC factor YlaD
VTRPEPPDPCAAADEALQRFLDGAPEPDSPALQRHWRDCRDCRERFAAARRLREGLVRRPAPPEPSALLTERIVVAVVRDGQKRDRRRWLAGAAVAAAVVLAIGVTWPRRPPGVEVADNQPLAKQSLKPHDLPIPSLRAGLTEAGTAVVGLTRRTVDETVGSSVLIRSVPLTPLPDPSDWAEAFQPAAQSLGAARQGLAEGLEPVTTSARRAARLLWRDLPMTE